MPSPLPTPPVDDPEATRAWVATHLGDLALEGPADIPVSPRFRGGQTAADGVLAGLDVTGYAARRNQVLPESARGASMVSPYVRHGLIGLRELWDHVSGAPARDRAKYRDELLWQEYARHLYARVGAALAAPLRRLPARGAETWPEPWPSEMACTEAMTTELHADGWLVNQSRMWMSSQWTVRAGHDWREGEDAFFAHLLDGSRAANRLGWQWTIGAGTGKPYSFSRYQVRKRAPELCERCRLREDCPIDGWPDVDAPGRVDDVDPRLRADPDPEATGGPLMTLHDSEPELVWLTAESLGDADPALSVHPELPAAFVFDEPLLRRLRLSGKRLVFLAEALGDLAARRELAVHRGAPVEVLAGRRLATTFAPVPGFRTRSAALDVAELHPWPWLCRPHGGPVTSFSAWRRKIRVR